ncbi:hypothetical protein AV530_011744 [Patagioenas fasciata monilis]|uniref:Uncharacterized protein n=1 Tax=Patagioenas fasciata monilis TaxID=372326 RepID=A0A1V4KLF9_PATFA|nr:hypothetical protein AV530_011744 [Patagioenas fasciata monilis]
MLNPVSLQTESPFLLALSQSASFLAASLAIRICGILHRAEPAIARLVQVNGKTFPGGQVFMEIINNVFFTTVQLEIYSLHIPTNSQPNFNFNL